MKEVPINIHGKTFILVWFSIYFVKILKNSFSGSYDKYILYKNINGIELEIDSRTNVHLNYHNCANQCISLNFLFLT